MFLSLLTGLHLISKYLEIKGQNILKYTLHEFKENHEMEIFSKHFPMDFFEILPPKDVGIKILQRW